MTFVRSRVSWMLGRLSLAVALAFVVVGALIPAGAQAAVPVVTDVGVYGLSDTSVRLVGTVNPSSLATSYVFQYGKSQAIVAATDPVGIGNGATSTTVSRVIDGLEPGTTYHYRLIASNTDGATPTSFRQFTTRFDPLPNPAGRGLELVSPAVKPGSVNEAGEGQYKATVAADGESFGYCMTAPMGAQVGQLCGHYIAQRGDDGWAARPILPDFCGQDFEGTGFVGGGVPQAFTSKNLDYTAIQVPETASCQIPKLSPAAPAPAQNLYRQNMRAVPAAFDLLAPMPAFSQTSFNVGPTPMGGSDDFSHVIYISTGQQAAGAPANTNNKIYDWHDGQIDLVSRGTDNLPLTTSSLLAGYKTAETSNGYGGVSDDGQRVFFQNTTPTGPATVPAGTTNAPAAVRLYMREDNTVTYELGRTECTVDCGSTFGEVFQWASEDGSRAVFYTKEKLVDTDTTSTVGNDLYMYRHSADPVADQNLSLLTADNEPADGVDGKYWGMLGMSDDGDTVYFVAGSQLVAGQTIADGPKLYQWRWNGGSPVVRYLAKFDGDANGLTNSSDSYMWRYAGVNARAMIRRTTPDGSSLLVDTVVALDTVVDRDSSRDVYRWTGDGGWACLSCQVPGAPSAGPSSIQGPTYPGVAVDGQGGAQQQNAYRQDGELIAVSSRDGSRVFFTSMDQLVAGDVNSVSDVYAWEDGRVSLISGGTGSFDSTLMGVSDDAEDVFFTTANRLVGWDFDDFIDVYDARVGGGFPDPPVQPEECEVQASECQAPPAEAFDPKVSSGGGSDNAAAGDRVRLAVARVSRQARARAARRGVLRLSARTSSAGKVAFKVRARIGGRNKLVGRASDRASGAGSVGVSVRLSRQARKRLAAGKRLRLSVVVSQPGARSRTATLTLRGVKS